MFIRIAANQIGLMAKFLAIRKRMRFITIFALALLASSCSSTRHISNKSIAYNDAVEMDANIGVLKNAVRASMRLPVEYTRIGNLTFTGVTSGDASTTINLGTGRPGSVPLALKSGPDEKSAIAFERLTGTKFFEAILQGVSEEELQRYWEQGWPREYLMLLMVERIEMAQFMYCDIKRGENDQSRQLIYADKQTQKHYRCIVDDEGRPAYKSNDRVIINNDPESPVNFYSFASLVDRLTKPGIVRNQSMKLKDKQLTPELPSSLLANGAFVLGLAGKGISWKSVGNSKSFQLYKSRTKSRLAFDHLLLFKDIFTAISDRTDPLIVSDWPDRTFENCVKDGIPKDENFDDKKKEIGVFPFALTGEGIDNADEDVQPAGTLDLKGCVTVVTRSPDAIMYYLGELYRGQFEKDLMREYCIFAGLSRTTSLDCTSINFDNAKIRLRANGVSVSRVDEDDENASSTEEIGDLGDILFYIERSGNGISPFDRRHSDLGYFEFRYLGNRYAVPKLAADRGRTMQAVTLVNQIIGARQNAPETLQLNSFTIDDIGTP